MAWNVGDVTGAPGGRTGGRAENYFGGGLLAFSLAIFAPVGLLAWALLAGGAGLVAGIVVALVATAAIGSSIGAFIQRRRSAEVARVASAIGISFAVVVVGYVVVGIIVTVVDASRPCPEHYDECGLVYGFPLLALLSAITVAVFGTYGAMLALNWSANLRRKRTRAS